MDALDKRIEQAKKDKLKHGELNTAFKHLKVRDFAPMLYLKEIKVDKEGKETEDYVADPIQVDRVAREAWNKIYAGNVKDYKKSEATFLENMRLTYFIMTNLKSRTLFQSSSISSSSIRNTTLEVSTDGCQKT